MLFHATNSTGTIGDVSDFAFFSDDMRTILIVISFVIFIHQFFARNPAFSAGRQSAVRSTVRPPVSRPPYWLMG